MADPLQFFGTSFPYTLTNNKAAGWWAIGSGEPRMQFAVGRKPNRFHRYMTRILLGWEWRGND